MTAPSQAVLARVLAGPRYLSERLLPTALWPAAAYLMVFYVVPMASMVRLSIFDPDFTLSNFEHLVTVPLYRQVLGNTVVISLTVTAVVLVMGYPAAYLIARAPARWSRLLLFFVMIPFLTSLLVRNYAWMFMLGSKGVINSVLLELHIIDSSLPLIYGRLGTVLGLTHIMLSYLILVLVPVMQGIDPRLLRAAQSLGAGPFTAFRRVYLPLTGPGIAAGLVMVFILTAPSFVTPAMLGGPGDNMIAGAIYAQVGFLNWGFASALATCFLVVILAILFLSQRVVGSALSLVPSTPQTDQAARPGRNAIEHRLNSLFDAALNVVWPAPMVIVGASTLAFLMIPIVVMFPLSVSPPPFLSFPPQGFSLHWYESYLNSPDWLRSTLNSAQIAVATTIVVLIIGVPAAFALARSRARLVPYVFAILLAPIIVPSIVSAIAIFFLLTSLGLRGSLQGVVLGEVVGALPLCTLVLVSALRNFDISYERAAQSLGASPVRAIARVTLPMLRTAVIAGAMFAFIHAFDELLIALFVSGLTTGTLSKQMWVSTQEFDTTIVAVSCLLVILAILVFGLLTLVGHTGRGKKNVRMPIAA